jgi:hypothetical protein
MIKRTGPGKYAVYSHDGKKQLSKPMSKKGATKRLHQIEYFKHRDTGGY